MTRYTVLLLALAACTPQRPIPPAPLPRTAIVLISIDGFHPDYLNRGVSPTLDSLARAGVRAEWMEPSFPTKTFPNHFTLVTGLRPDHHGIVANNIRDPDLGRFSMGNRDAVRDPRWWQGEPIWVTVARAGLKAAPIFWPGSEAPIGGALPDRWQPFEDDYPRDLQVDSILTWLELPVAERPVFMTMYTSAVDHAGHTFGPDAPEVNDSIATVDAMVGRLAEGLHRRGLADHVNIIVVSDHGMSQVSADRLIVLDSLVDLEDITVHDWGPVGMFQPKPGKREEVYAALRDRHPALDVYWRDDVPGRFEFGSHSRVPEIIAISADGWRITTAERAASRGSGGDHGYDNTLPSMRATFIGSGPGFRSGIVAEPFSNIHLYPMMAHLLGLTPAVTDGSLDSIRSLFH